MKITEKNTNPVEGIYLEKGVLKCLGNHELQGEKLKYLFSSLYDYFLPRKRELKKIVKDAIGNNIFLIDTNSITEGFSKIEEEIDIDQALIILELSVYFTKTSTPFTDDYSYSIELDDVTRFELYDCFGKNEYVNLSKDEIYEILKPKINKVIY